jgi:hypothetical protein
MLHHKDIKIPIFNSTISVYIDETVELLLPQLKELYLPFTNDCKWRALSSFNKDINLGRIYITREDFLGDAHHESIHAANYILENIGLPINFENDEATTYLSTYIFKELLVIEQEFTKKVKQAKSKSSLNSSPNSSSKFPRKVNKPKIVKND